MAGLLISLAAIINGVAEDTKEDTGDTKLTEAEDTKVDTEQSSAPTCHCGDVMIEKEVKSLSDSEVIECDGCAFMMDKNHCIYYSCPKGKKSPHTGGYDLCAQCSKYIQKCNPPPVKEIHNREKLYFIYNNSIIKGPMTKDEIITAYICKKLKETKMYVMTATNDSTTWTKLQFPAGIFSKIDKKDKSRCGLMEECEKINGEFRQKYPDLYASIIDNILCSKLKKISIPEKIPKEEEKPAPFQWVVQMLGKLLALVLALVLIAHVLPVLLAILGVLIAGAVVAAVVLCVYFCVVCWHGIFGCDSKKSKQKPNTDKGNESSDSKMMANIVILIVPILALSGIMISPILTVHFVLRETDEQNEIQSWMISYITWGIFSFATPLCYIGSLAFEFEKAVETINNLILIIIGVKFGTAGSPNVMHLSNSGVTGMSIMYVFPALASLLPAAICGFIANFVLEEKFELKCSADILSSICSPSEHGCCDVISSHDYENSYVFIGGLASNIIATWAIIRFCGYLIVNAFPDLALYAERKK